MCIRDSAWGGLPNSVPLPELEPLFPRIDRAAYLAEIHPKNPKSETKSMTTANAPTPAPAAATPAPTAAPAAPATIAIDQFMQIELRVATILSAEPVPKSEKLLKMN